MLFCEILQRGEKDLGGIDVIHGMEADELAVSGRAELVSAEGVGFHAVRLVKGARDAIAVQVRAEKHGDDVFLRVHI